jgi:hypothetical protein
MRQFWGQFCRSIAKGYRGFESPSLRQRVSGLRDSLRKCANCARAVAMRTRHRDRRALKWRGVPRHFVFLSAGE